jgi:mannose-1-phosphate guanylyltransferase/mannose-6-phosphate isomerase
MSAIKSVAGGDANVQPVILCGGSGTRLWPLSRKSFPKQFIPLVQGKSLLQLTIDRLAKLGPQAADGMLFVTAEEHRFLTTDSIESCGIKGRLLLEPQPRNTAAAMAIAALAVAPDQMLLFSPADHHVPDGQAFADLVQKAIPSAQAGSLVTFGVAPTFPSTAYGYIEQGEPRGDGSRAVVRFVEKPTSAVAEQMVLAGNVVWNAGIFLCLADALLDALERFAPDILACCKSAMSNAKADQSFIRPDPAVFVNCRSESIDYAVMQKHPNIAVFPFSGAWSDVGSWNAAADLTPQDEDGNRVSGSGTAVNCTGTFVFAPYRPVVALGTKDLLIVDTPDALLVAASSSAEDVRQVVVQLEAARTTEANIHRKVFRPWGWYDGVDAGDRFNVKRIYVKPGGTLSLQMHHHRAEHWIVVRGTAEVIRGEEIFTLSENESTFIRLGQKHRLRNPGKIGLELIEVQSGSYLGEDDIVRYEDSYGRD